MLVKLISVAALFLVNPFLAVELEAGESLKTVIENGCMIGPDSVFLHAVIHRETHALAGPKKGQRIKGKGFVHIACDTKSKNCRRASFPVADESGSLTVMNFHVTEIGKLLNQTRTSAIIDLGTNGLYAMDLIKKKITFSMSGPSFEERGSADCEFAVY